ncbi:MAG: AAA family ATPase [Eubacteriales bacterium]|nr:AAA family ATPase [Eubacteriales bacterium]
MVIQKVSIKNFKGIHDASIEFKPGFNLIKGENGKGKTSILEAISVGLGGFVAGFNDVNTRHFSKDEIRKELSLAGDGSCDERYIVPTEVYLEVSLNGEEYRWTRGRTSVSASRSTIQPRNICKIAQNMSMSEEAEYPVIIYEGAGRVWSQKRERTENILKKKYSRSVGYIDALSEASNIKLLLNWCVKMEQVAWQKGKKITEYEAAKKAVSDFMNYINGYGDYNIFYDKQLEELMYRAEGTLLPISSLSAGYQSLIWMVFDIAYRMAVLNPNKKADICETKGIVLIDEIDMHLHPKWQWNIIDSLRKVFPQVQFIATTHAPVLFASARDVWIVDIENEEYSYSWSHYGIDINTALEDYQNTTQIPVNIQQMVDKFYDAMDKGEYENAKVILDEMDVLTAPDHSILIQMRTRYEFETMGIEE